MSRIAGVFRHGLGQVQDTRSLAHASAMQSDNINVEAEGGCALAYIGRQINAARKGNIFAVVDGFFWNTDDLPDEPNDAAILIHLYDRHGFEKTLKMICGDFAVALYDATTKTLWLGRDRAGVRPCYYTLLKDGAAFCSRPRPLLNLPGVSLDINRRFATLFAGSHYRTFDNDPHSSPYAAVRQLPAAHLACIHDGQCTVRSWWHLEEAPDFLTPERELGEQYRELFFRVTNERLHRAPAPAFCLSGGMDSSSVLATAVRLTGRKQHAFSSVYDDKTYDESKDISSMLETNVAHWNQVRIGQIDVIELVREMIAIHDEPVATATWLSHWLLCKNVTGLGFQTLFGGLGGDELNAGEYEYFYYHFADLQYTGRTQDLEREIAGWMRHHDHPLWPKNTSVVQDTLHRCVRADIPGRCLPDRQRIEKYANAVLPECMDVLRTFEPEMENPFTSYLKNRTWQDISREAAPCCLRAEDRHTRALGLTNMNPFYDHRLMEFMFRVPGSLKIRDGVTKILLRQAMQGILPEPTRTRIKKTGWNAPAHVWFSGSQANTLRDMIQSPQFLAGEYYDTREVLRLLDEHCRIVESNAVAENHMMFLWQLVNLELWLENLAQPYPMERPLEH